MKETHNTTYVVPKQSGLKPLNTTTGVPSEKESHNRGDYKTEGLDSHPIPLLKKEKQTMDFKKRWGNL